MNSLFLRAPKLGTSKRRTFVAAALVFSLSFGSGAWAAPAEEGSDLADVPAQAFQEEKELPAEGSDDPGAQLGQGLKNAREWQGAEMGISPEPLVEQNATLPSASFTYGMDVSGWQPYVNWSLEYSKGSRFAYVKVSEGTSYTSPTFSSQYNGAGSAGMYRGGYHFAIPSQSNGATQARFFVSRGGGWSADGRTLPGLLDIEYNPYAQLGNICFNMSQQQMVAWISDFAETYRSLTGRYPAVYSTTHWWRTCTGDTRQFSHLPLHLASYSSSPGAMPSAWSTYDIWQYSDSGPFAGDSNVFNGSLRDLRGFATYFNYRPVGGQSALARAVSLRDVSGHPFRSEISWLASSGITQGWSDGTFRPEGSLARDAMAAFIYRMSGSPSYTPPQTPRFKDVPRIHPFYKEISWLADQGITQGYSDGTFRPGQTITRDAMAAFFYRLAGQPAVNTGSSFRDVPSSHQFYREISWFASQGITRGWSDGTFRPQDPTSRGAMAAFIYRFTYRA